MMSSSTSSEPQQFEEIGGLTTEQLLVLNEAFGKIDTMQAELRNLRAKVQELDPTFGVDAPDGDSDGHVQEELQEVKHIIDEAAQHEDANLINKQHELEDDVHKFHARDPEHDW